jgi:hypothetical protein
MEKEVNRILERLSMQVISLDEARAEMRILGLFSVSNNEVAVCRYCNSKNILKGGWCDDCGRLNRKLAN